MARNNRERNPGSFTRRRLPLRGARRERQRRGDPPGSTLQSSAWLGLLGTEQRAPAEIDGEWIDVAGVGEVFRQRGGQALLVSPAPLDPAMKAAIPQLLRHDARPFATSLRTPTLVLHGSADPLVPRSRARALAEAIPGATFVVLEGAGHVPTASKHEGVARAFAAFCARLPRQSPNQRARA